MKCERTIAALGTATLAAILLGPTNAQPSPPASPPGHTPPAQRPPRSPDTSVERGYVAAPPGSESLTAQIAPNTIQMFMNDRFKGTELTISAIDSAKAQGGLNELDKGLTDSMSSVRWNLTPGIIVVFYEDATGKGEQLILWGQAEYSDLDKRDFNDKVSRWAWYDIGSAGASANSAGSLLPPRGSEPCDETLPANTLQMFIDKNFRDDLKQVSPVTAMPPSERHNIPSTMRDSLTSLRWNLPPGVMVMLYQDAEGRNQQVALWGQGQIADLDIWDFNDKASRWSWTYLGARPQRPAAPPQQDSSP